MACQVRADPPTRDWNAGTPAPNPSVQRQSMPLWHLSIQHRLWLSKDPKAIHVCQQRRSSSAFASLAQLLKKHICCYYPGWHYTDYWYPGDADGLAEMRSWGQKNTISEDSALDHSRGLPMSSLSLSLSLLPACTL